MLDLDESQEPLDFDASPSLEWLQPAPPELDSPAHTIQLLDHDSEVLLFLFDLLSGAGYRVTASSNASDALDDIARWHPEILIANMEMHEVTASELRMRVRMTSPSTRIIWTSERLLKADAQGVLRDEGADLIAKPIEGPRVLKVLESVLAR